MISSNACFTERERLFVTIIFKSEKIQVSLIREQRLKIWQYLVLFYCIKPSSQKIFFKKFHSFYFDFFEVRQVAY